MTVVSYGGGLVIAAMMKTNRSMLFVRNKFDRGVSVNVSTHDLSSVWAVQFF